MITSRAILFTCALGLFGCTRWDTAVLIQPAPYRSGDTFVLAQEIPVLDEPPRSADPPPSDTLEFQTAPEEIAASPQILANCLRVQAPSALRRFQVASEPSTAAFRVQLGITRIDPGFFRADRVTTASASAEGASASSGLVTAGTVHTGDATVRVDIHAPDGTLLDRVYLRGRHSPALDAPLEQRVSALCSEIVRELGEYVAWRTSS